MEVLGILFDDKVRLKEIGLHTKCNDSILTYLAFGDDLLIFFDGAHSSANSIKVCFELFTELTGLEVKHNKSKLYCSEVNDNTKIAISDALGIGMGSLPVKYLGLPLLSSGLIKGDCQQLIERLIGRIYSWQNRLEQHFKYDSTIFLSAPVSNILVNSLWSIYQHLKNMLGREITEEIESTCINRHEADLVIWTPSQDGVYKVASTYEALRDKIDKVDWFELCWGDMASPRSKFTTFKALKGALAIGDKMVQMNIVQVAYCTICGQLGENGPHLFMECILAAEC
ncbi:hypothetical protein GIB67_017309 [Kingdonia uniflora]|uniref:Reverse transcriptase zinc-binding domain-containing protein n=1 Tax=Kingdonia uniflora TaxID=39325 RepID=A0A7J7N5E0_9MAGN|nr:hypothetical protein GIB67_017309 [Kingdonia uniflora]